MAVRGAEELTQEEYDKRVKDAEILEEKLKFITEKIPTRIMNTAGSNAGAGSGEFHMYRMARRREIMRQQRIAEDAAAEQEMQEFEEQKTRLMQQDEERTAKRRAKRQKQKAKQQQSRKSAKTEGQTKPQAESGLQEQPAQADLD